MLLKTNIKEFFEFVSNFVTMFHGHFTVTNVRIIMDALVQRVEKEHEAITAKPKKTLDMSKNAKSVISTKKVNKKNCEFRIKTCWNVIRYVSETEYFSGPLINEIE
jgi:hypothetical protein